AAPAAKDRPKAKDEPGEDDESAEEDEPTKAEPKAAQAKLKAKEKDAPLPRPDSATGGDGKKAPAFAQASPGKVLAAPATRRRARETGVDLAAIRGTGPSGRVTNDDLKNFVDQGGTTERPAAATTAGKQPAAAAASRSFSPVSIAKAG